MFNVVGQVGLFKIIYFNLPPSSYPLIDSELGHPNDREKFRILIVDDDPDVTLTFKVALQEEFVVDVFNDPLQSLSHFKAGFYDLLLLDIRMPEMNGFELHREIEMIDDRVKVCFMTSFVTYYESKRNLSGP